MASVPSLCCVTVISGLRLTALFDDLVCLVASGVAITINIVIGELEGHLQHVSSLIWPFFFKHLFKAVSAPSEDVSPFSSSRYESNNPLDPYRSDTL